MLTKEDTIVFRKEGTIVIRVHSLKQGAWRLLDEKTGGGRKKMFISGANAAA